MEACFPYQDRQISALARWGAVPLLIRRDRRRGSVLQTPRASEGLAQRSDGERDFAGVEGVGSLQLCRVCPRWLR